MNNSTQNTKQRPKNPVVLRWILGVFVATIVLGIVVIGLLHAKYANKKGYVVGAINVTPKEDENNQKVFLARAEEMRTQWKVWATHHGPLLHALCDTEHSDDAILAKVHATVPASPLLYDKNEGKTSASTQAPNFSWQPQIKSFESTSIKSDMERKDLQTVHNRMLDNYHKYHDYELSDSVNTGAWRIVLWASGRITRVDMIQHHIPGQPVFSEVSHEVTPKFKFLQ